MVAGALLFVTSPFVLLLNFWIMEVSVYSNLNAKASNKPLFKRSVVCLDTFSYEKFVDVMRSVFGPNIVIEFLVV